MFFNHIRVALEATSHLKWKSLTTLMFSNPAELRAKALIEAILTSSALQSANFIQLMNDSMENLIPFPIQ